MENIQHEEKNQGNIEIEKMESNKPSESLFKKTRDEIGNYNPSEQLITTYNASQENFTKIVDESHLETINSEKRIKKLHSRPDLDDEIFPSKKKFKSSVKMDLEERNISNYSEVSNSTLEKPCSPNKDKVEKHLMISICNDHNYICSLKESNTIENRSVNEVHQENTDQTIAKKTLNQSLNVEENNDRKDEKNEPLDEKQSPKFIAQNKLESTNKLNENDENHNKENLIKNNEKSLKSDTNSKKSTGEKKDEVLKDSEDIEFDEYFKKSEILRSATKNSRKHRAKSKSPILTKSKSKTKSNA